MLTQEQKNEITKLVEENLDRAENIWHEVGDKLVKFSEAVTMDSREKFESVPSLIPGHSIVYEGKPKVETYIALVADMRDSSGHLLQAISGRTTTVSQLQRVYYETSALLPALAQTIKYKDGVVTEYLGDGVLSLFLVKNIDDEATRYKAIYAAYDAASNCIGDTRDIINHQLLHRYNLPALNLGVGLSMSEALVTLIGLKSEKQAKVVGECVYRATKLSAGVNEISVDEMMKKSWPKGKAGTIGFRSISRRSVNGYVIEKKN